MNFAIITFFVNSILNKTYFVSKRDLFSVYFSATQRKIALGRPNNAKKLLLINDLLFSLKQQYLPPNIRDESKFQFETISL